MSSAAWTRLLRMVPEKDQNGLMLQTINRTEIAIQSILRFDVDFLIIKGRLAGSQEAGRVFFIPYEQIDHVGFYRATKDEEFDVMFADLEASQAPAATAAPDPAAGDANGSKTPTPLKSSVLERFRSRGATIIGPSPLAPRPGQSSAELPTNGR